VELIKRCSEVAESYLNGLLFGVKPRDPPALAIVSGW